MTEDCMNQEVDVTPKTLICAWCKMKYNEVYNDYLRKKPKCRRENDHVDFEDHLFVQDDGSVTHI